MNPPFPVNPPFLEVSGLSIAPGTASFKAGRRDNKEIVGDSILLGDISIFDRSNIGKCDF